MASTETYTYTVDQSVDGETLTWEVHDVAHIYANERCPARTDLFDADCALVASFLNAHRITRITRSPKDIGPPQVTVNIDGRDYLGTVRRAASDARGR